MAPFLRRSRLQLHYQHTRAVAPSTTPVVHGRAAVNKKTPPVERSTKSEPCYTGRMKVEEIAEAVAKLPPDQLARFRRWFNAFDAGRSNHADELDSAATKLGRLAGRAFAELRKRAKEP